MKSLFKFLSFSLVLVLAASGCGDDDLANINSTPEFATLISDISTAPGEEFTFSGVLVDPAGIKSVRLQYEPWFLDKLIEKDSLPLSYNLNYRFTVPEDAEEGSTHAVMITATNAADRTTTQQVNVNLNADFVEPEITINGPVDGFTTVIGPDKEIVFDITATDQSLKELRIESDFYSTVVALSGTEERVVREVDVATPGLYPVTITAFDMSGNSFSRTIEVNIVETLSFTRMFITALTTEAELEAALFGQPYATTASTEAGEEGLVFTARYYAEQDGEEVRFIPQSGSFAPYTFGASADNPGEVTFGDNAASVPGIVLNEGAGYYEVRLDLGSFTYTTTKYMPTDDAFPGFFIVGQGPQVGTSDVCTSNIDGSTACWTPASGKAFNQDANNPYRWSQTVIFADSGNGVNNFIFTGTTEGWSIFWRLNAATIDEVSAIVPGGGVELAYEEVHFGTYLITADTHLNTFTAVRQ